MSRKIGKVNSILFWHDVWLGVESLKEVFPRLDSLSLDKESMVANMRSWDGNIWRWRWKWRRALFAWEEEALLMFTDTMMGVRISND